MNQDSQKEDDIKLESDNEIQNPEHLVELFSDQMRRLPMLYDNMLKRSESQRTDVEEILKEARGHFQTIVHELYASEFENSSEFVINLYKNRMRATELIKTLPQDKIGEERYAKIRIATQKFEKGFLDLDVKLKEISQTEEAIQGFKSITKLLGELNTKIIDLLRPIRDKIRTGIVNFTTPEAYGRMQVEINEETKKFALEWGSDIVDSISRQYPYMTERYQLGLKSHKEGQYYLSIFIFLSLLDGILKKFCEMHLDNDCCKKRDPNRDYVYFKEALDHFMKHYRSHYRNYTDVEKEEILKSGFIEDEEALEDIFIEDSVVKNKLLNFIQHRNQIMHGDEFAHFDENISLIALLFLILIIEVIDSEIEES